MSKSKILLTPEQAIELLNDGYQAITQKRYAEAAVKLRRFCQYASSNTKHYLQAHKTLLKLYLMNGQHSQAIAFHQQLLNYDHEATRTWANSLNSSEISLNHPVSTAAPELETTNLAEESNIEPFQPKTLNEFKTFCQKTLARDLKLIESVRKQVLYSIIAGCILLFIGIFKLFALLNLRPLFDYLLDFYPSDELSYLVIESDSISLYIPIFLLILFFVVLFDLYFIFLLIWLWVSFYSSRFVAFSQAVKLRIPERIFEFINENKRLKYFNSPSPENTKKILEYFHHSQILQGLVKPNNIIHDNYIEGTINGINVWFANIRAELEVKHEWASTPLDATHLINTTGITRLLNEFKFILKLTFFLVFFPIVYPSLLCLRLFKALPYIFNSILGGRSIDYQKFETEVVKNELTRTSVVFKGLFFKAKFNKNVKHTTIVYSKSINVNIHALNHGTKQLIKLEDPKFERLFTVYSDDQVEARYILSTSLMEKILKFRQKTDKNIYISFVDNTIYIAIEQLINNEIVEPNLYKSFLRFAPLKEYFENINLVLGVVNDLSLNRRIWSQD